MPKPSNHAEPTDAETDTFELTPAAMLYLAGLRGPRDVHRRPQLGALRQPMEGDLGHRRTLKLAR